MEYTALIVAIIGIIISVIVAMISTGMRRKKQPQAYKLLILAVLILLIVVSIVFLREHSLEKKRSYDSQINQADAALLVGDYDSVIRFGHLAVDLAYDMESEVRALHTEALGYYMRWQLTSDGLDLAQASKYYWGIIIRPEFESSKYYTFALCDMCTLCCLSNREWDLREWKYAREKLENELPENDIMKMDYSQLSADISIYQALAYSYRYAFDNDTNLTPNNELLRKTLDYNLTYIGLASAQAAYYDLPDFMEEEILSSIPKIADLWIMNSLYTDGFLDNLDYIIGICEAACGLASFGDQNYIMLTNEIGKAYIFKASLLKEERYNEEAYQLLIPLLEYRESGGEALVNTCFYLSVTGKCNSDDILAILDAESFILNEQLSDVDHENIQSYMSICFTVAYLTKQTNNRDVYTFGKTLVDDLHNQYYSLLSDEQLDSANELFIYFLEGDETAVDWIGSFWAYE